MWTTSGMRSALFAHAAAAPMRAPKVNMPRLGLRLLSTESSTQPEMPEPQLRTPVPIRYPYFVNRVGVNQFNLPVYADVRNAGSRTLTMIRKVDGDVSALCRDLFEDFGWGDPFDKMNPDADKLVRLTTQAGSKKIVIRGHWTRDIKAWLEERGF